MKTSSFLVNHSVEALRHEIITHILYIKRLLDTASLVLPSKHIVVQLSLWSGRRSHIS